MYSVDGVHASSFFAPVCEPSCVPLSVERLSNPLLYAWVYKPKILGEKGTRPVRTADFGKRPWVILLRSLGILCLSFLGICFRLRSSAVRKPPFCPRRLFEVLRTIVMVASSYSPPFYMLWAVHLWSNMLERRLTTPPCCVCT